ncbi:unnamed protein product [Pleuronectes platessa]|uniref:Uncharacterized protein n=1 Tax=Pleuronectes platessa TaxID=8262 RepID=A0A9N7VYR6_PLEPL|nr:unnamed protein product [Pleuronectes platessa]
MHTGRREAQDQTVEPDSVTRTTENGSGFILRRFLSDPVNPRRGAVNTRGLSTWEEKGVVERTEAGGVKPGCIGGADGYHDNGRRLHLYLSDCTLETDDSSAATP